MIETFTRTSSMADTFETDIWTTDQFYAVGFGQETIEDYLAIRDDRLRVNTLMDEYDRIERDKARGFGPSPDSHSGHVVQYVEEQGLKRLPDGTRPLYEYIRWQGTVGQALLRGLGSIGILTVPGMDGRGDRFVFAALRDGELDINNGSFLADISNRPFTPEPYALRRVGYAIPRNEEA
jgi:hypothetical protein